MKIITTQDGSHSLYSPEFDDTYHSQFGALQESEHIFIQNGVKSLLREGTLHIFEVGFGTGLNAYLTALRLEDQRIKYTSIDLYPLGAEIVQKLNYPLLLEKRDLYDSIMQSSWNGEFHPMTENFQLRKFHSDFIDFELNEQFDCIYFDAFGPSKQPAMWSEAIFNKCFLMCKEGGILITYSSKGQVKRHLESAGFHTEKLSGPKGKRHILRAVKEFN